MAKGIYIGVNSLARKVKKAYFGVNNVARKIKKIYIGVGGVAKLVYGSEPSVISTSLIIGASSNDSASSYTHAAFYGDFDTINFLNTSLVKSIGTLNGSQRRYASIGSNGSYIIAAGGNLATSSTNIVDAFNSSLVRSVASPLWFSKNSMGDAKAGKNAIFYGGYTTSIVDDYEVYDANLVKSRSSSSQKTRPVGCNTPTHGLFAGGYNSGYLTSVIAFDTSAVKTSVPSLSVGREAMSTASVGGNAIFAGGHSSTVVDAYSPSLVKVSITSLPSMIQQRDNSDAGVSLGDYAIFAIGNSTGTTTKLIAYDTSLVLTIFADVSVDNPYNSSINFQGEGVGKYAVFSNYYNDIILEN